MTQPTPNNRKLAITLGLSLLAGVSLFSTTSAAGDDAVVSVAFTPDGMGFTATSTKELSNVIVQPCVGAAHKHDGLTGMAFTHTETSPIAGVWVKSGNNGAGGSAPPGAGQRFDNLGVVCSPPTSTSTSTTPPPSETTTTTPPPSETTTTTPPPSETTTTTPPPSETTTTTPPPETNTTTPPPETNTTTPPPVTTPPAEIPVFPSWASLAVGVLGALGGALAVFRRRLP